VNEFKDSPMAYSWADGISKKEATGLTTGAVYVEYDGIETEDGYEIKIAKDEDFDRELTFTTGIWRAESELIIYEDDVPVYTEKISNLTGGAKHYLFTVKLASNKEYTVRNVIKKIDNKNGNVNLTSV